MSFTVETRPKFTDFCYVPEELKGHFAAMGKRLSWQRKDDDSLTMRYGQGVVPVNIERLRESKPELYQMLKDSPIKITAEGHLQRYDSILCVQDQEEWDEYDAAFRARSQEKERGHTDIEALEEDVQRLVEQTGKHSGNPLLRGRIPTTRESVKVSKKLGAPGVQIGLNPEE